MADVFISLGSNLGEQLQNLEKANHYIQNIPGLIPASKSRIYYTEPQGVKDQAWFANQVVKFLAESTWSPQEILQELLQIEDLMGRIRTQRFGPRIIDLDILLCNNKVIDSRDLVLPHPRMHQRAFVLVPLLDIDPELSFPSGQKIKDALSDLDFRVWKDQIWQG